MPLKWIGAIMNSFEITLFVIAYIIGFAISLAIFYTMNMASHKDDTEEENISLFTAIYLSLLSWICIFFIILVVLVSTIQHIFENSKFNEKYKALNERFMHKKRDKKDG